jgi:hypothetical protein
VISASVSRSDRRIGPTARMSAHGERSRRTRSDYGECRTTYSGARSRARRCAPRRGRKIVLSADCSRPATTDTRAVLNGRRHFRAVGSEAQRLATRVEAICHRMHVTLAGADAATAETLVRAGGPRIYVFRRCSSCGRPVYWVAGVDVAPGHWAHSEPTPHAVPML